MTNAMVQPASWRCRTCGGSNPLHSRSCSACPGRRSSPDSRALQSLFENAVAQVVNPGAEVVYNNIYNFAPSQGGDVTVMTPQETSRATAALNEWTGAQEPARKKHGRGLLNNLLTVLTCICIFIMSIVLSTIGLIVVLSIVRMANH